MSSNFMLEFTFWTKNDINNVRSDKYSCLWVANWNGFNNVGASLDKRRKEALIMLKENGDSPLSLVSIKWELQQESILL
jgi:hypothetical protein